MSENLPVLISGAGPVGLFAALRLAQAGIEVVVLEKEPTLNDLPRATGYFGASLLAFQKSGILEKVRQKGFAAADICWRKPLKDDGKGGKAFGDMIASMPLAADDTPGNITGYISLAQSKLTALLYEEATATGHVKVVFNTEVTGIQQGENYVKALVKSTAPGGRASYEGSFIIGADGAKSAVRKSLGIALKGHTWSDRLIAIDVYFETPPFDKNISTHIIVDPVYYGLTTPIEPPVAGTWSLHRCSIATPADDPRSDEELESKESVQDLLERFVPGPRPLKFEVYRAATYKLHQRCAGSMARGRCLLAGDAAHINNASANSPIGAMGLTTGLLDADAAAEALILILDEGKLASILNTYSDDWLLRKMRNPTVQIMREHGEPLFKTWPTDMRKLTAEVWKDVKITRIDAGSDWYLSIT